MTEESIRDELLAALASSEAETQRPLTTESTPSHAGHDLLTLPTTTPLPSSVPHSDRPTPAPAPIHSDFPSFPATLATDYHQSPNAKRSREQDPFEKENDAKRPKTEQDGLAAFKDEPPDNLDLETMLQSALASYDVGTTSNEASGDITMSAPEPPRGRTPSVSTGSQRVEERIMRASSNSGHMIRSMSIPVLGNIAVQIILRLSQESRLETANLLADQNSEFHRDYQSLISILLPARKIFSTSPLLSPEELGISDPDDRETIRVTNLATIAASTFGANDVPLADIQKTFFSVFVNEEIGYEGSLTELLVGLKTRVFIDSLNESEEPQHVIALLDQLFPSDFAGSLTVRKGKDTIINADEEVLVRRIAERRGELLNLANDGYIRGWCLGSIVRLYANLSRPSPTAVLLESVRRRL